MTPDVPEEEGTPEEPGLLQRYPKLGILIVAGVAYAMLCGMCAVVLVLALRA